MGEPANGMGKLVRLTSLSHAWIVVEWLRTARIITRVYAWVSGPRRTPFTLQRSKVGFSHYFCSHRIPFSCLVPNRMGLLRVSSVVGRVSSAADFFFSFGCSQPETVKRVPPKNYSENFVFRPNELRILRTK